MRLALFIMTLVSVALLFLLTQGLGEYGFLCPTLRLVGGTQCGSGPGYGFGDRRPAFPLMARSSPPDFWGTA